MGDDESNFTHERCHVCDGDGNARLFTIVAHMLPQKQLLVSLSIKEKLPTRLVPFHLYIPIFQGPHTPHHQALFCIDLYILYGAYLSINNLVPPPFKYVIIR